MRNRKRLLILTSTFPRWKGDEDPPFVFELCKRLKNNYDIQVLTPHFPGVKPEEQYDGIHVKRFRYFFSSWERLAYQGGILANLRQNPWKYVLVPPFLLAEFIALVRLLRRQRFDLIHAHWLFPQGAIALLARLLTKPSPPLLCTSHGGDLFGLKGSILSRIKKWVILNSDAMTVVSQGMQEEIKKLVNNHGRIHVVPMGTDLKNRFIPPKEKANSGSLLFVGRLVEKKGLKYLIEALPLILKRYPLTKLRIAGDGPERRKLEFKCAELGITDRVIFLGAVRYNLLPELYRTSDVVVFPSIIAEGGDQEGFGLVLVEALGCECATITTDLPAMQDIIIDEKTGLVVPQKNIRQLAERVICLLDDPALRRSLGQEGRCFVVERYDWGSISRKYVALIESITG